jgi:hypothetical protein
MKVEIFSVLDYNGNKNNEPEMLSMYLDHYTKNFPNSKINIFMCNFPTNYNGGEVLLLKKYGCHIKTIEFDNNEKYYEDILNKEVKNYIEKETNFRNSIWKDSKSDWVILCDIDEILFIDSEELKKINSDAIEFVGYCMIRYNKNSNFRQLTYGIKYSPYNKTCIFKPTIKDMNFALGQHRCNPTTSKINKGKYKLLHYKKIDVDKFIVKDVELVRNDIEKEVSNKYIFRKIMYGSISVNYSYEKQFNISKKGYWLDERLTHYHCTDKKLCKELVSFFKKENNITVADFGCGLGEYVRHLNDNDIFAHGYDGNPMTSTYNEKCYILDLSKPIDLDIYDGVISFEVGEHIPKECEDVFIENMHKTNKYGIILTWAPPHHAGYGHINCRDIDYIVNKICNLGYTLDIEATNQFRKNCELSWLELTISVLRKNK